MYLNRAFINSAKYMRQICEAIMTRSQIWDLSNSHVTNVHKYSSVSGPEFKLYRRKLRDDIIMQEYLNNAEDICLMYFGLVSYRQREWLIIQTNESSGAVFTWYDASWWGGIKESFSRHEHVGLWVLKILSSRFRHHIFGTLLTNISAGHIVSIIWAEAKLRDVTGQNTTI
jgi:hypothetical protein